LSTVAAVTDCEEAMSDATHPSLTRAAPTSAPSLPTPHAAATQPGASLEDGVRKELRLDVERLIDAYQIEVTCHSCRTVHPRSIGWLRVQASMECPNCQASIVLRTSVMNEEMRRVGRQLRKLEQQLAQMIERAVGILGQ
jgi:hypothetical protein